MRGMSRMELSGWMLAFIFSVACEHRRFAKEGFKEVWRTADKPWWTQSAFFNWMCCEDSRFCW
jgi:hypothetical protein